MKSFETLCEAVTKSKLIKMNNKMKLKMQSDPLCEKRLLQLNMNDDDEVSSFITEIFGEPVGLYQNTFTEQKNILRRLYDDYHKQQPSYIRPEYTELGMEP